MGEESRHLKEHIDETRNELGRNMDDLEAKVKRTFDWRAQFEDHPMTAISLAFGAGLLLSSISSSSRSPLPHGNAEPSVSDFRQPADQNGAVDQTLERFKRAFISVAAVKAQSFLDEILPGFQKEYERSGSCEGNGHLKF